MTIAQQIPVEASECRPCGPEPLEPQCRPSHHQQQRRRVFCVMGGALETGNLGVAALGTSAVKGLRAAYPDSRIIVQSWSHQPFVSIPMLDGPLRVEAALVHESNSLKHTCGTKHLRTLARCRRWLPGRMADWIISKNRTLGQLLSCDAILDVSAGDSFSDLYGPGVFHRQVQLKLLAQSLGKPLVLLPQTYGPFTEESSRVLAGQIINKSLLVANREKGGLSELDQLVGEQLGSRAVCCPDIAFILDPVPVDANREPFLGKAGGRPLIGLNVSGLLYFSKNTYGQKEKYSQLIEAIVEWAIDKCGASVLLVPHVIAKSSSEIEAAETENCREVSDTVTCATLMKRLGGRYGDRLGCIGWPYGAGETKFLIGQCDFFIGARMHSCIAAISQAVPTVTLAYSKKAQGVLGCLDIGDSVLDLREVSQTGCMEHLSRWYSARHELNIKLEIEAAKAKAEVLRFFQCHLTSVLSRAEASQNR